VEEVRCQRMSEARGSQAAIVTVLVECKHSVDSSLSLSRNELVEFRKGVSAENLSVISVKLDAASRDSSSKLGKLGDRLNVLEERVSDAAIIVVLSSVDNPNNDTDTHSDSVHT
jgi:hypothetical protein